MERLTVIKEYLPDPDSVSYNQLRVILNILEFEYGVDEPYSGQTSHSSTIGIPGRKTETEIPQRPLGITVVSTEKPAAFKANLEAGKRKLPSYWKSKTETADSNEVPALKKRKSKSSVFSR